MSEEARPIAFHLIAEREFTSEDGEVFTLEIGKPYFTGDVAYKCPWRLRGPGYFRSSPEGHGYDSLSAFIGALEMVLIHIKTTPVLKSLQWIGPDLGLIATDYVDSPSPLEPQVLPVPAMVRVFLQMENNVASIIAERCDYYNAEDRIDRKWHVIPENSPQYWKPFYDGLGKAILKDLLDPKNLPTLDKVQELIIYKGSRDKWAVIAVQQQERTKKTAGGAAIFPLPSMDFEEIKEDRRLYIPTGVNIIGQLSPELTRNINVQTD